MSNQKDKGSTENRKCRPDDGAQRMPLHEHQKPYLNCALARNAGRPACAASTKNIARLNMYDRYKPHNSNKHSGLWEYQQVPTEV